MRQIPVGRAAPLPAGAPRRLPPVRWPQRPLAVQAIERTSGAHKRESARAPAPVAPRDTAISRALANLEALGGIENQAGDAGSPAVRRSVNDLVACPLEVILSREPKLVVGEAPCMDKDYFEMNIGQGVRSNLSIATTLLYNEPAI
ncbi:uncharacterized protein [Triticum aestivum]|uniref:uncharacterized protein n=1 Tax=Triticum aestivum TaxID=4565 RepID=UPI001D013D3D|nr:uncharacterized protein LOC123099451 [Triticum aestivum]